MTVAAGTARLGLVCLALLPSCSSSSGPPGSGATFDGGADVTFAAEAGSDGGGPSLASCLAGVVTGAPPAACSTLVQCLESSCQADLTSAFGSEWDAGTVAGPCAGFEACATSSACTTAAGVSCAAQTSSACRQQVQGLAGCAAQSCATAFTACETSLLSGLLDGGTTPPTDAGLDSTVPTSDGAASDAQPDANDSGAATPCATSGDAGTTTAGASCVAGGPGMTNCGASVESCCTSLEVPCGSYDRTYQSETDGGPTDESDPATVSGFRLDKYMVTVGRYRQFASAVLPVDGGAGWLPAPGSGRHTHLSGGQGLVDVGAAADAGVVYETGWLASYDSNVAPTNTNLGCLPLAYDTWTATPGAHETLPVNCVNWYEAYAFCIWDGGFLPSQAEAELAAAGGSAEREYPWGATDPGAANQYAIYGDQGGHCYYPSGTLAPCTGVANIAPVGTATLGAGLWGQLDLAGNLAQWGLDYYTTTYVVPTIDGALLTPTFDTFRTIRGGSYQSDTNPGLLATTPGGFDPTSRNVTIGFRCARTP